MYFNNKLNYLINIINIFNIKLNLIRVIIIIIYKLIYNVKLYK